MNVTLETSLGNIVLELDSSRAPISVENFVDYVRTGHYDGTIFHRVIDGFMIQGGGFEPGLKQKPTRDPIENEATNGLSNLAGTVAMARTSAPHSASAQFFINVNDNKFLDHKDKGQGWGYAVFGRVCGGIDVVNKIKDVDTGSKAGHTDVPLVDVIISRAYVSD